MFLPLLAKLMVDIEDPLFERDEAYFLSGEGEFDDRLRKFVRFVKVRRRLGEDSNYDWPKYETVHNLSVLDLLACKLHV